jgi:putative tryptophan/tyrosine transport system substrate-binding protein
VTSFNRPGGNVTGITAINSDLSAKRLGILCDLVPGAMRIGVLSANAGPTAFNPQLAELNAAAAVLGRHIEALSVGDSREIEAAFASFVQKRINALVVNASGLLAGFRVQIATAAARHAIPTIYSDRHNAEAGGLMSYGSDGADQFRLVGVYVGRVLKGEKPAGLPVMRPSKFELVINLQTARTLGIEVPPLLLARADEVIYTVAAVRESATGARSASSRRCSDMTAVGGTPDGRRTRPAPPRLTHSGGSPP